MKLNSVALAFALTATALAAAAAGVKLRIPETTDLHMTLLAYDDYQDAVTDQYGLARTNTLIKAARAEAPNSLLFDNDDLLQGNPLGDIVAKIAPLCDGEVHPDYQAMNALMYDAANIGDHDFNYGLPFPRRALEGATFPYANVYVDDAAKTGPNAKPGFTPHVLLERELVDAEGKTHLIKVGVTGFVTPQITQWDKTHLEGRVAVHHIIATARRYVPEMCAKGAQLVIATPHSGLEHVMDKSGSGELAENEGGQLSMLPGIDAILFGHSHAEFPGKDFADRPNTLKAALLSGAQGCAWIEMAVRQFRRIDPQGSAQQPLLDERLRSYNFDTFDGVTCEFDLTQPARYDADDKLVAPDSHRVLNKRLADVPILAEAKFIVATTNYRAFGSGNFSGLDGPNVVLDSPNENRQALIGHLAQQSTGDAFDPSADGKRRIRPVPGSAMTFATGSGGARHLARHPGIRLIK